MISLTNHDFQWGRSEVVIIYPDWYYPQNPPRNTLKALPLQLSCSNMLHHFGNLLSQFPQLLRSRHCRIASMPGPLSSIAIENGPVEIVDLCWWIPIQNGDGIHRFLYVYQRIPWWKQFQFDVENPHGKIPVFWWTSPGWSRVLCPLSPLKETGKKSKMTPLASSTRRGMYIYIYISYLYIYIHIYPWITRFWEALIYTSAFLFLVCQLPGPYQTVVSWSLMQSATNQWSQDRVPSLTMAPRNPFHHWVFPRKVPLQTTPLNKSCTSTNEKCGGKLYKSSISSSLTLTLQRGKKKTIQGSLILQKGGM